MANIRFKLLDDNESSQSNIRFKVIDNNQSNTTVSMPQTSDDSSSTKKKKKNKKIITDVNLPIANNLKNIKMAEESNLPILPLNQSTQKSSVGKDISLPTFYITNNRTPELPKVLPQNVTPKEPSGSDEPSILKTALTGLNYLGQGVMKGAESLMDGAVQVATSNVNPYYWFNQDKLKQHQNIAQELIEKDATNNLITTLSGDENFNEKFLDKDSMITSDNLGGKVVTTIGQMMPAVMTGGGTAANLVLGMQSYGGGVEQAYNEGATRSQANLYGLGNAAIEIGTEKLFGGIPGTKSNGWLDTLVARGLGEESFEEVSKSISKEIIKAGYKMVGEAGEEALAEIVNPILKNATYSEGEKVNWNNVLESAIVGGITGGILEAPSNISNIRTSMSNQSNVTLPKINNVQSEQVTPAINDNSIINPAIVENNNINNEFIANQNNMNYNTIEGDLNGQETGISFNKRRDDRGRDGSVSTPQTVEYGKNNENVSERKFDTIEFKEFEQQARSREKTNLTEFEVKLKDEINGQYKKNIVFFDDELLYDAGASLDDANTIYISNKFSENAQKFATYHEIMESNIYHNKDISREYITPIINDIINSDSFIEAKRAFSEQANIENASDYLVAKDLFCDLYASEKSGIELDYENKLSDEIIEEIHYAIDKFESLLNNKQVIVPLVRENNDLNLPDKEYYLNKIKELESVNYSDLNPEGKKLYNEQMQKYKAVLRGNPTEAQSYDDVKLPTRKEVQRKYMNETDITNIDFDNAKKMSKFAMNRNTAIRLNEKIFGKNIGSKINEKFFYPIKKTESDRIRFLNSERNDIKSLGIKPKSIESSAVQKWGERKFVNDKGEYVAYTETMLMSDVPDAAMRDKVKKAAKTIRNKYDKYLESINNKLTENGYDPIPARDDYFMHFEELTDMFSQIGIPTKVNDLPTDINGVTDQFRPGKQFFANAMRREGLKTTYDAITGIDRYLEGASNVIYHTDDIQRLRTLEKYIRDTYGKENGLSEYENLTKEELIPLKDEYMDRLEKINSNHLSEYASWLQEYTNVLAGKKSVVDRSIESFFGRKVYKYLQFAKKQVGSNMTGFNIGSALTNFISGTQGMAKTNKTAFMKGTLDTVKNIFVKDNFIDKSDFLTTRFGSDKISKTTWEKISNAGQVLMSATDYFTANQIVRSKYHEYLQKGYTDAEAISVADKFADKLMAGRGKGDMPNIFNSHMLGLVTQFQLEVNNQLDSMFYDTFTEDYARNSKSNLAKTSPSAYNALGATFAFGQLLAFAYLFNNEYERIVGRRPAFDIIDILISAFEDMEDEEKDIGDVFGNIFNSLADNLPFVSTFTGGGRIPLSSALPNLSDLANGDSTLEKELKKPLYYLLPPTGGGQVKKTIEGLSMFSDDKEITGSYTDSGNLRFPVADTPKNRVQAALFGQYASENAREYFDEGYAPLKENQQKQYKELNIPISNYWKNKKEYTYQYNHPERYAAITAITDYNSYVEYNKEISNIKKKYEDSELRKKKVMEYIDSLDLTKIQKAIFKKLNYNSYSNYDSEIMRYIQKYDYTPTERKNAYKALGMYKEK